jgi:hypothetical protein
MVLAVALAVGTTGCSGRRRGVPDAGDADGDWTDPEDGGSMETPTETPSVDSAAPDPEAGAPKDTGSEPFDGGLDSEAPGADAEAGLPQDTGSMPVDGGPDATPEASVACIDLNVPLTGDALVPMQRTTAAQLTRVSMSALKLVAHRSRGRLYALAAADDADHPGKLVIIDASNGQIIDAVSVGAEPSTLAITDDESKLWVGSRTRFELREVNLSGAVPELATSYALPAEWGPSNESLVVVVPAGNGARPTLIDYRRQLDSGVLIGQVTFAGDKRSPRRRAAMPQIRSLSARLVGSSPTTATAAPPRSTALMRDLPI